MKPFALRPRRTTRPTRSPAVAADPDAVFLAGGTNLVDHLKLGVVAARACSSTSRGARPPAEITRRRDGGLLVGAGVRNSELAADRRVRERYPVLAEALLSGASGAAAQHGDHRREPVAAHPVRYFQDVTTPCNKRSRARAARRSAATPGTTRSSARRSTASPPTRRTWPSRWPPWTPGCACSGRTGERVIPFADLHRLPGDRAGARHRARATAS